MNITMLGSSGSGKTSYLSAISGLFWHGGEEHFVLRPQNKDFSEIPIIYKKLESINTLYTAGKFPDGTGSTSILKLELLHENQKVVDVNWIDYRGGDLKKLVRGDIPPEQSDVYAKMLQSDVVMVFVDAAITKELNNTTLLRYNVGATEIVQFLDHISQLRKLNVVFILSKSDSSNIKIAKDEKSLSDKVKLIYAAFFNGVGGSSSNYMIIPVGVVGLNNSIIEQYGELNLPIKHVIKDIKNLQTYNVASSFAKTVLLHLNTLKNSLEIEKESLAGTLQSLEFDLDRPENNLIDILFHRSNKRIELFDVRAKLRQDQDSLQRLSHHAEGLKKIALSSR